MDVNETLSLRESCYHISLPLFLDNNKQENVYLFPHILKAPLI